MSQEDTPVEKVICPSCGQSNLPDADFCWECYARLRFARDGTLPLPPSVPQRRRVTVGRCVALVLLLAVAVLAAYRGVNRWTASPTQLPDTVGGFAKLDDPAGLALRNSYRTEAVPRFGTGNTDAQPYADQSRTWQVELIWIKNPPSQGAALLSGQPFLVPASEISLTIVGGTTYSCTPFSALGAGWLSWRGPGGICTWKVGSYAWVLLSRTAQESPAGLADSANIGRGLAVFVYVGVAFLISLLGLLFALRIVRRMFFS